MSINQSTFQNDARERTMRNLFNLVKRDPKRDGVDAVLVLEDHREVPFELKSAGPTGGISTARDVGREHFAKWRQRHWIVGIFLGSNTEPEYCLYAPPRQMEAWIRAQERFIGPDLPLLDELPQAVSVGLMKKMLGDKEVYTLGDARALLKSQKLPDGTKMSSEHYRRLMDLDEGYSPARMTELAAMRASYLLDRGATRNNPHIEASYYATWERIDHDHAVRLRVLVQSELAQIAGSSQGGLSAEPTTAEPPLPT